MTSLEQHLTDHEYLDTFDGWESCECGWREEIERRSETGSVFTHAAHVADAWRESRTVRTVEELYSDDHLAGTTIQEVCPGSGDHEYFECARCIYPHKWEMSFQCGWCRVGNAYDDDDCTPSLPVLILWTPEDGAL